MRPIKTNNFWKGREGHKIKAVVLHITEGSLLATVNHFENPRSQTSAHWIVDEYGNWIPVVDEKDSAWHCGRVVRPTWNGLIEGVNPNLYTIGVECVVRKRSIWIVPRIKQWLSWARGIERITKQYGIEMVNHNEINAGKICPGKYFNKWWAKLLIKYFI
ncbi:unnamed protein product [marine sediment metagenome]|uniref:N-acetylmuramoyl-L-alanine amidase n=1 Tax=marine sediment metagenome TaxID=412755 RepID=X1J4K2_9ZZZZ